MLFITLFVSLCAIFVIVVDLVSPDTIRTPLKTALGNISTKRKAKLSTATAVNVSDLNSPNKPSNKKHI